MYTHDSRPGERDSPFEDRARLLWVTRRLPTLDHLTLGWSGSVGRVPKISHIHGRPLVETRSRVAEKAVFSVRVNDPESKCYSEHAHAEWRCRLGVTTHREGTSRAYGLPWEKGEMGEGVLSKAICKRPSSYEGRQPLETAFLCVRYFLRSRSQTQPAGAEHAV